MARRARTVASAARLPRDVSIANEDTIMRAITQFIDDERGVTAIEYALIAALVAVGIIVGATALGGGLSGLFDKIATKINGIVV